MGKGQIRSWTKSFSGKSDCAANRPALETVVSSEKKLQLTQPCKIYT